MNSDFLDLPGLWAGWLWTVGVAACRWPLTHPIADEAAAALKRRDRELRRAARLLTHVSGLGPDCESALVQSLHDLVEHGPWGDDEAEVLALAEATVSGHFSEDEPHDAPTLVHRAQTASLERLLGEVLALRSRAWEDDPARVERTPVSRVTVTGAVAGWIVGPRWRMASGPEAARRAMKRIVDGRGVLDQLDSTCPAGLEHCVVEVHYWLRTGELGQPWMPEWQAPSAG